MNNHPEISVILPVFNAESYLRECIDSILSQTFPDFELIIINDGSTDGSEKIVASFKDNRIRYIKNEQNKGLVETLNIGIGEARGNFIARMDADDVCMTERFQKQFLWLERHPETGVLGSFFIQKDEGGNRWVRLPMNHDEIIAELIFKSPVAHPTVIFRAEVLKKYKILYDVTFPAAEDYELWTRLAELTNIENIPEYLLIYRMHERQETKTKRSEKEMSRKKILLSQLNKISLIPDDDEFRIHFLVSEGRAISEAGFIYKLEKWLLKIYDANKNIRRYDEKALDRVLGKYWIKGCENSGAGFEALYKLLVSSLTRRGGIRLRTIMKAIIKIISGYKQH
ncbi:MAG: glycosyltransferase [Crocinitomicaceae bacterium]|nr:glycosyltransferase [Crocinitomicaceae bacterium]